MIHPSILSADYFALTLLMHGSWQVLVLMLLLLLLLSIFLTHQRLHILSSRPTGWLTAFVIGTTITISYLHPTLASHFPIWRPVILFTCHCLFYRVTISFSNFSLSLSLTLSYIQMSTCVCRDVCRMCECIIICFSSLISVAFLFLPSIVNNNIVMMLGRPASLQWSGRCKQKWLISVSENSSFFHFLHLFPFFFCFVANN